MKNLKELRKMHNISQEQLSNIINVSKNTVSQYESGKRKPKQETLFNLAKYFNVSIDYLLGYSTDKYEDITLSINQDSENFQIGKKIKTLRLLKNQSQREMAKDLSITNPTVSMWENGIRTPDILNLYALSKYFNVPISYFFEDSGNDSNKPIEIKPYQQEVIDLVLELDLIECSRLCGYIEHQFVSRKNKENK